MLQSYGRYGQELEQFSKKDGKFTFIYLVGTVIDIVDSFGNTCMSCTMVLKFSKFVGLSRR
jgi:hypothetical protein